jgi:hypothetical protein
LMLLLRLLVDNAIPLLLVKEPQDGA